MGKVYCQTAALALGVIFGLSLSACAEGWKADELEVRDWLPDALPHLKRVIVLLRTCQPRRENGYNTIWVDGSNDDITPRCSFGDDSGIKSIRKELKQAGVLGVNYWPSGSATRAVNWAEFILFREGIVTAGSMTSVMYHASPQKCADKSEGDDSFRITDKPITQVPCRWFWRRSEG